MRKPDGMHVAPNGNIRSANVHAPAAPPTSAPRPNRASKEPRRRFRRSIRQRRRPRPAALSRQEDQHRRGGPPATGIPVGQPANGAAPTKVAGHRRRARGTAAAGGPRSNLSALQPLFKVRRCRLTRPQCWRNTVSSSASGPSQEPPPPPCLGASTPKARCSSARRRSAALRETSSASRGARV